MWQLRRRNWTPSKRPAARKETLPQKLQALSTPPQPLRARATRWSLQTHPLLQPHQRANTQIRRTASSDYKVNKTVLHVLLPPNQSTHHPSNNNNNNNNNNNSEPIQGQQRNHRMVTEKKHKKRRTRK